MPGSERQQVVLDLLNRLPLGGLDPLKELFWAQFSYGRVNKPLSRRGWSETAASALAEDPLLFAAGGEDNQFQVIYARLNSEKLLLGWERPVVTTLLRGHPYALFVVSNASRELWHFINVRADEDLEKRRLFRRITIGRDERLRTAAERIEMLDLAGMPDPSPLGIQRQHDEAFDVEKVTKQFYEDYAVVFEKVEKLIAKQKELGGDDLRMFTQSLFNRLMFLRFMERKRWLTFDRHTDYLRALYAAGGYRKKSFYKGRLWPLFFEGLAVQGKQQSEAYGCVPYLNGGLFERTKLDDRVTDLPDEVFAGILSDERAGGLFYHYNFTVEESTPLDVEVAVDPEMLGKVFEELVTGRHETGSYYTPRPVVSFMCREALKGYLSNRLLPSPSGRGAGGDGGRGQGAREKIKQAVAALVDRQDASKLKETHAREILAALDDLKAVDPACGSGAYLLGLLQEMIALYRLLQSEKLVKDARTLYGLKLRIISQSLYGVDIDPFATNIAMLRLWLSLTVEADEPVPLPNLDFKIETGDSLLGPNPQEFPLLQQKLRFDADALVNVKRQYFLAHGEEKESHRRTIEQGEARLRAALEAHLGEGVVDWRIQFAEVFAQARKGFDVVLANPPYVRQELITDLKSNLQEVYPEVYAGAADLYVYFYSRAIQLLRLGGFLVFIAPNKFFRAGYGKKLRQHLASFSHLRVLIDFADYPIFQAITYPSIIVTKKCPPVRSKEAETLVAYNWKPSDDLTLISPTLAASATVLPQSSLSGEGWRILDQSVMHVLDRLRATGQHLSAAVGSLYRGIVTGCNEVFEIEEETRRDLIEQDARSADIIRPWLRGRNVGRWSVQWGGGFLIFTRRGIQIDRYPAIKRYLARHRHRLEPRPRNVSPRNWAGRKPGTYKWYEVQDAIDYWREFDKPKIVYQVIATYQQFAFTREPFVSNDKTWIIPDPPPGLLGILNSKIAWFFLDQIAPKLQGGAFELRSPYVSQIPIVPPTRELIAKVSEIQALCDRGERASPAVTALENDIDEIVVKMYGLSKEEEHVIDEALEACGNRFPRGAVELVSEEEDDNE